MMTMPNRGGNNPMRNIIQMLSMLPKFMQNPLGAMLGSGLNIPENVRGNPQAMTNFLLNSGQMTQEQYDTISPLANMAQGFIGRRF